MKPGKLVAITGPAAVGKSTVAKALLADLTGDGDLWLLMELDVFARALPRDWIAWGERVGRRSELGFTYGREADGSVGLTLGADGRQMLAAFHRSVAAVVRSGMDVICETVVHDEGDWADWQAALDGIEVCWVRLTAPVARLEERERAERPSARPLVGVSDIEADTDVDDAQAIARRIAHAVRSAVPP